MTAFPLNDRCTVQQTNYVDNLSSSSSATYSDSLYPYLLQDTQQQQQQQQEGKDQQKCRVQQQTIPLGYLPTPSLTLRIPSRSLESSNINSNGHISDYINDNGVDNMTTASLFPSGVSYLQSTSPLITDNTAILNNPLVKVNELENISQVERGIAGFVSKLYQSLQATEGSHKYARWSKQDDKDMFVIDCIPKFTEEVLPRLFKHCKFPSFVRQLNIYGFQRDTDARKSKDTKDKETCRWHHPYFRPGRRDLLHLIRRKGTQRSRRKRIRAMDEDPETIVNIDSGDDYSENDDSFTQRRLSSVSSALSNPIIQDDYTHYSSPLQQIQSQGDASGTNYQESTMIAGDTLFMHRPSPLSSVFMQDSARSTILSTKTTHCVSNTSISTSINANNTSTSNPASEIRDNFPNSENQGDLYTMHDLIGDSAEDKTVTNSSASTTVAASCFYDMTKEQRLQQQLRQLQTNYYNDRDFFIKQIQLAYSHIEEQRVHIAQLEALSAHRQLQQRQQHQRPSLQPTFRHCDTNPTMTSISSIHSSDLASEYVAKEEMVYDDGLYNGEQIAGKTDSAAPTTLSPTQIPRHDYHPVNCLDMVTPPPLTPSHMAYGSVTTSPMSGSSSQICTTASSHQQHSTLLEQPWN